MNKFAALEKYSELNPIRPHIKLKFEVAAKEKELDQIVAHFKNKLNPDISRAIIFCSSRRLTEEAAKRVNDQFRDSAVLKDKAGSYHAGMDAESREKSFDQYKEGTLLILFATKAFGMGMDIPNIHYIYHIGPSSSFEDYLQEVGRAGRDSILLKKAGFSSENPIEALCYYSEDAFAKYRDWIQKTQMSWNDLCNVFEIYKSYRSRFIGISTTYKVREYLPIPLNIISISEKYQDSEISLDTLFKLSLYWLERARRIKSRYFIPAFLEFKNEGYLETDQSEEILDDKIRLLFKTVYSLKTQNFDKSTDTLVEGSYLLSRLEINREELYKLILKAQRKGVLKLVNKINIKRTEYVLHEEEIHTRSNHRSGFQFIDAAMELSFLVLEEISEYVKSDLSNDTLLAIKHQIETKVFFEDFIQKLSLDYEDEELSRIYLKTDNINHYKKENETFKNWIGNKRSKDKQLLDLLKKQRQILRSTKSTSVVKAALYLLSTYNGVKVTSQFSEENNTIIQSIQLSDKRKAIRGYCKKITEDCEKLLTQLQNERSNVIDVNELILRLPLVDAEYSYVEILFYLLRKLGYIRFPGGLIPMAVEMNFNELIEINGKEGDKDLNFEYQETIQMKKLRHIVLESFSKADNGQHESFIKDYFQSKESKEIISLVEKYSENSEKLLEPFRSAALKERVEQLNPRQLQVYQADIRKNVSVIAGPGTGKTHTLVLRVARLIQEESILPNKILVLAYNRAVVEELKLRLKELFTKLGYKSLINSLQVYTFHGLVGSVLSQNRQDNLELREWEETFIQLYKQKGRNVLGKFSDVEYVFIDEFQDITDKRLKILSLVAPKERVYLTAIGDPNQSIYGYERANDQGSRGPEEYYQRFNSIYHPIIMQLIVNYRSTPDIIKESLKCLPKHSELLPIQANPETEEFIGDVTIIDNRTDCLKQFCKLLQIEGNTEVAILYRSNVELYKDFSLLKELCGKEGWEIEIKGSTTSFTNQREIAYLIDKIIKFRATALINDRQSIRKYVDQTIKTTFPNWDGNLMADFVNLFEYFYDQYNEGDSEYAEFVEFLKEITQKDDGQLFKILKQREKIKTRTVILTTIHRVKGMEYQNVVIPSSIAKLPFDTNDNQYDRDEYFHILDEERRLRYVAFSRAKNNLIVEIGNREKAIAENKSFIPQTDEGISGIPVKSGQNNIVVSWKAGDNQFFENIHNYIHSELIIGQRVNIKRDQYNNFYLNCNHGNLEKFRSQYAQRFINTEYENIYVESIVRYTYDDCKRYDDKNNTNYADRWSKKSKQVGYIYLVNFFGYAIPLGNWERQQNQELVNILN